MLLKTQFKIANAFKLAVHETDDVTGPTQFNISLSCIEMEILLFGKGRFDNFMINPHFN